METFIQLPNINISRRKIIFLLVVSAIFLHIAFSSFFVFLQKSEFMEQSILDQSKTAFVLLSRDIQEGNYRKVMERFLSGYWPRGVTVQSILFYDLISQETITSSTNDDRLLCQKNLSSSYIGKEQGNHVSCLYDNGLLLQVIFISDPFASLTKPQFITVLIFNLLFAGLLILFTVSGMHFYLGGFIGHLNSLLQKGTIGKNIPVEFRPSFKSIKKLSQSLEFLKNKVSKNAENLAINTIYKKVIHNIRNPLNTINITLSTCTAIDETKEDIIRKALNEIEGSVDKALDGYRNRKLCAVNLYDILEQARNEINLITGRIKILPIMTYEGSGSAKRSIDPVDFKNAIVNILNNAVEAMPEGGKISIKMKKKDSSIVIEIEDQGSGIDEEILPKLGKEGLSYNKPSGNGLGLYTAKRDILSWGGKLFIGNRTDGGKGTIVTIVL